MNYLIVLIEIIGVLVVLFGVAKASISYVRKELVQTIEKQKFQRQRLEVLRFDLGYNLVLSLEFFLAADLIKTVLTPSWDDLGKLALLVVIRTMLSYFLNKELS